MTTRAIGLALAVSCALAAGCVESTPFTAEHLSLEGELGDVTHFAGGLPGRARGRLMAGLSEVNLEARDGEDGYRVMNKVSVEGGLDDDRLDVGRELVSLRGDDDARVRIRVYGCAGPNGRFTYFQWADRVDARVEEGSRPGSRRLVYTATWERDEGPQRVHGSFEYAMDAVTASSSEVTGSVAAPPLE